MEVIRWNPEQDGPLSERALREKMERQGYSVSRYTYPPGTYFGPHTHDLDKMDAVVAGQFQITMQGRAMILRAGDAVRVPSGAVHAAEVVGIEPVISLDGVKSATE